MILGIAGEDLKQGDPIYQKADGRWYRVEEEEFLAQREERVDDF